QLTDDRSHVGVTRQPFVISASKGFADRTNAFRAALAFALAEDGREILGRLLQLDATDNRFTIGVTETSGRVVHNGPGFRRRSEAHGGEEGEADRDCQTLPSTRPVPVFEMLEYCVNHTPIDRRP